MLYDSSLFCFCFLFFLNFYKFQRQILAPKAKVVIDAHRLVRIHCCEKKWLCISLKYFFLSWQLHFLENLSIKDLDVFNQNELLFLCECFRKHRIHSKIDTIFFLVPPLKVRFTKFILWKKMPSRRDNHRFPLKFNVQICWEWQ